MPSESYSTMPNPSLSSVTSSLSTSSKVPPASSSSLMPFSTSSSSCSSLTSTASYRQFEFACFRHPFMASSLSSFRSLCRLPLLLALLIIIIIFIPPSLINAVVVVPPRSSCRSHLLNGEGHTSEAVLPIKSPSGNLFWLLCRFPSTHSSQIARLSVQTVVHNALEGQWFEFEKTRTASNATSGHRSIGIGYQVSEAQFLRSLISQSDDCQQNLRIRWPKNGGTELDQRQQMFTFETLSGKSVSIGRNLSRTDPYEERVPVPSPPLIRLHRPLPRGMELSLEPLICRQMVIPRPECHFELRTDSDRVRLRLDALRKKWPQGNFCILNIAFRTGKPNGRLLELGTSAAAGEGGTKTAVDLIDGYLLLANHIVHPVRLVADGSWHSLNLDLHSLSLRIDGQGTAISLVVAGGVSSPVPLFRWMDILLVGEVAAVRVQQVVDDHQLGDNDDEEQWICARGEVSGGDSGNDDDEFIDVHLPSANHLHIFGQSPVCDSGQNFCNCNGPNSALSHGGSHQTAECAMSVSSENAFHLSRTADRLAFFIVPHFGPRVPISVLLQSEEATGLVLFGVYTLSTPSFGEMGGRVQVHFVGDTVFASFCSAYTDGTERCLSCAIRRPKAFPSSEWVRFSLFHQQNLQFLAVDRQVCLLSPNSDAVEAAELYKITESNVLLVGGTFYAKTGATLGQRMSDTFRRQFQDNTREKAPSIQGCITEIVVKGQHQHMDALLVAQQQRATARDGDDGAQMFAVRKGCANCATECNGAPCFRIGGGHAQSECQCGAIYATALLDSPGRGCDWVVEAGSKIADSRPLIRRGGGIRPPQPAPTTAKKLQLGPVPIRHPSAPRGRRRLRLAKVWALLRVPDASAELSIMMRIGGVHIGVGDNGRRLVVEAADFAIREEFTLHQRSDSRLQLLSLEVTPSVGTAYASSSLTIRLNNDRRRLVGFAEIPLAMGGGGHQPNAFGLSDDGSVEIFPFIVPEGKSGDANNALGAEGGGCVAALVFHYVPTNDEGLSTDQLLPLHRQVDYVPLLLHVHHQQQLHQNGTGPHYSAPTGTMTRQCRGIIDPTLWDSNSTSWGHLLLETDTGSSSGASLFSGQIVLFGPNATWRSHLSVLITTALIIVILITLLLYGIVVVRRRCRQQQQSEGVGGGGDHCVSQKRPFSARTEEEEKRPLRSYDEDDGAENCNKNAYAAQSVEKSSANNKQCNGNNGTLLWNGDGATKVVNGFGAHQTTTTPAAADRRQQQENALQKKEDNSLALTMAIEQLDGSPKHGSGGAGIALPSGDDGFIATPLNALYNSSSGRRRIIVPSPAAELVADQQQHQRHGECLPSSHCSSMIVSSCAQSDRDQFIRQPPIRALSSTKSNGNSPLFATSANKMPQQQQCQRQQNEHWHFQSPNGAPIAPKDEL